MLGDRGDAASRLVGALSSSDLPSDLHADRVHDDVQRYRAVVSALLDVRPDHAGGYFDEALDAALAANRVDVHLARTLRWWQRASVRAAEDFVAQIIPTVHGGARRRRHDRGTRRGRERDGLAAGAGHRRTRRAAPTVGADADRDDG